MESTRTNLKSVVGIYMLLVIVSAVLRAQGVNDLYFYIILLGIIVYISVKYEVVSGIYRLEASGNKELVRVMVEFERNIHSYIESKKEEMELSAILSKMRGAIILNQTDELTDEEEDLVANEAGPVKSANQLQADEH